VLGSIVLIRLAGRAIKFGKVFWGSI